MLSETIKLERIPNSENIFRISFVNIDNMKTVLHDLQSILDESFSNGAFNYILDLKNLQFPTESLIVLLIEATSRARRLNGDLKLINVSHSAKNNLLTFTPLSYLSMEGDEKYAIEGFQNTRPIIEDLTGPTDDIVELPIVEKIQENFQEIKREKGYHLRVGNKASYLYNICDFVTGYAEKAGMIERDIGKTKIAVYEACLNVIEHAYHSQPNNWIDVWVDFDKQKFTIIIQDYGLSFEFKKSKRYDVHVAMEERKTGGFGLYIIQRSMDEVDYHADPEHGNQLIMKKYLTDFT